MDDPTSSLDNKVTQRILDNIKDMPWLEKTFIFSTNDPGLLDQADQVVYLQEGLVTYIGAVDDIKEVSDLAKKIEEFKSEKAKLKSEDNPSSPTPVIPLKLLNKLIFLF